MWSIGKSNCKDSAAFQGLTVLKEKNTCLWDYSEMSKDEFGCDEVGEVGGGAELPGVTGKCRNGRDK